MDADSSDEGEVSPAESNVPQRTQLRKELGFVSGVGLMCGTIIGSGIFLTPTDVVDQVGSVGMSVLVWVIAGALVLVIALCYCELGTSMPVSGGEYVYLRRAFGGLPAFLYTWVSTFGLRPISAGIITLTCARYVSRPLFDDDCDPPEITLKLIAISALSEWARCFSHDLWM